LNSTQSCLGCAYTEGTPANQEPWNNLRAQFCAMGAIPFVCHHGKDWLNAPQMTLAEAYQNKYPICQGWRREVQELADAGYFNGSIRACRAYAQIGLELLGIVCDPSEKDDHAEALQGLKRVFDALIKHKAEITGKTNGTKL